MQPISDYRYDIMMIPHPTAGNRCLNLDNTPSYMRPVKVGVLLQNVAIPDWPPALAPIPPLTESEVTEPPLPPVSKISPSSNLIAGTEPATQPSRNAQAKLTVCIFLSTLTVLVASLMSLSEAGFPLLA